MKPCFCFEYVGDNPNCPAHGDLHSRRMLLFVLVMALALVSIICVLPLALVIGWQA